MISHSKPALSEVDVQAVVDCLRGGMINEGAGAAALEAAFAARFAGTSAVVTGSGSQALRLALEAVGVSAGDEVIVPSYLCAEVLAVIERLGAIASIVDVEADYLMSYDGAAKACTRRTGAIVFPYTLGFWRDVAPFRGLGVPLIEDCAQYLPPAGGLAGALQGDLAFFSFEATKMLAAGEGGLVLARDSRLSGRLADLKRFSGTPYKCNLYPLSDLQASLARSQLSRLDEFLERRRAIATLYLNALSGLPAIEFPAAVHAPSAFFRLPIQLKRERASLVDEVIGAFAQRGVSARRPVDDLLHRLRPGGAPCPMAERLYERTLSLPLYPALSDVDVDTVIETARVVFGNLESERAK